MANSFLHSGNAGDIISSLAFVQAVGGGHYYLRCGQKAGYAAGVNHPCGSTTLNMEMATRLLPLLLAQPYITGASLWQGETITHHLDMFRSLALDFCKINLARFYHIVCPEVSYDTSKQWLFVDPIPSDQLVINRTGRYQNAALNYSILGSKQPILFLGLTDEYDVFATSYFECNHTLPSDFLHAARLIAGSRCFVGNQSVCWWIAEATKTRRVLEVDPSQPNSCPVGLNAYEAWTQAGFEKIAALL